MAPKKQKKPRPRPKIEYPPVPTKKWIPPDKRPKKKRKPAYVKPPGITQPLKTSSLGKVWHNFRILDNRTFLLGSFSETHKRFRPKTNGFQTPCNCAVAIAFSKLYDMPKWDTCTLDKALELGDQLYLTSWQHLDDRGRKIIKLCEIYASFFFGDTKVTISMKRETYNGKLFEDFDESPFLSNVIKDFFNDKHVSGIITTQEKHLAFWSSGKFYFLFAPTDHDEKAYPWKGVAGRGYSFVMRFKDTNELVDVIHENINKKINSKFTITPCSIIRMVKLNTKPPDYFRIAHCPDIQPEEVKKVQKPPKKPKEEPPVEEEEEKLVEVMEMDDMEEEEDNKYEEIDEYSPDVGGAPFQGEGEGKEPPLVIERREVSQSMIPLERAKAESVTYFASVVLDKVGILRASTFQGDTRFSKYKGKQSVANAMAALTMLRIHKSRIWYRKILDEVLLLGETIHKDSVKALPAGQTLKVTTTSDKFTIGDRDFTPDVEEFTAVGKLQSPKEDVFDLLPALQEFFRDNDNCVITGPLTLAVWKEDGLYYMFDPNERDHNGLAIMKSLQVGSELKVLEYTPGVACVIWFTSLKDLAKVYMNNVDKPYRRDPFVLSRVQINDSIVIPDPWNNFQGVAQGKWILRGTFNQNDRRFDKETRNIQCTAAASMALAYSRSKHVKQWTIEDVDEVLIQGDTLYKSCVNSLKESNKFIDAKLMVDEVQRKFPLEGNEINLDIQDCLVNGLLDANDDNDAYNLKKGMQEFFKDNETGVVTTRSVSVAVWKNEEVYYYYDSHSRDDQGVINNFGTSCVLRILKLEDLAKAIETNLEAGTSNIFNISRVGVKIWEMTEDGIIRPPLNNYTELSKTTAILRALYSERSLEFKLNRGRQTIPMCLVAVAMLKIYAPSIWSHDVVDEIIFEGDKLFTETMVSREKTIGLPEENDIDEVYPENCLMDFSIGFNKFSLTFRDPIEGNFEEHFKESMALFLNAISEDEADQKEALVTSDVYTVMTWKDDGVFYLFDPNPRDDGGQVYGKDEWTAKMELGEEEGEDWYEYPDEMGGAGDSPTDIEQQRKSVASQASEEVNEMPPKHSSHYWRQIEDSGGRACAMWFTSADKLIEHILENTPPTKREDITFKILPVTVNNKPEVKDVFDPENTAEREDYYSGDWYQFKEIDHGRWILRGTMDLTHIIFPAHNRGRQSVAMCYAALAFVKRFALSKFKTLTLDDILKYGDKLHSATRFVRERELKKNKELKLSEQEIEAVLDNEKFGMEEISRAFCIGLDQMRAEVTTEFMRGEINAREDMEELLDVKRALTAYFDENRSGILVAKNLTVAVWRGVKVYYMFDPNSRGPNGVQCSKGEACITRYLDLAVLTDVFVKNLIKEGRNNFAIHQVRIKIVPCPREPKPEEKERPEERPKFNGFNMVMPGKSILRGTMNQDDAKFGRGKNVQCAPIALVALTMTLIHKASIWTKPIVDEILILGDELYAATLDTLGFEYNPWEQGMTLHLVNKDYKMGLLRANCELRTMDQRGIIDIKHPKVLNLRQGIERFFEENTHGVIETETLTVAIWEEEEQNDLIYMYDPNPRGPAGLPFNCGTACILTFETPKLAADHFISNIMDKAKRSGEFVITPVEIVVGNARTKPKVKRDPCSCKKDGLETNVKKPTPTQCEKRRLRKMAEEERAKKEALRIAKLGRFEYHTLSNGDAILRGSKSQTWKEYSINSQGNQDIPNCFAAFVIHRLTPVLNWHYKHIDLILDIGDQLYKDSYITYSPRDPKLGFKNILRKVFIKDCQVALKVFKPVMANVLTPFNLEIALINYFQQEAFGILSANEQHVALFFKQGFYYMFDPHDRDVEGNRCVSGCACVMKFETLQNLINKYIDNVITMFDSVKNFTITLVTIGSISKSGLIEPA